MLNTTILSLTLLVCYLSLCTSSVISNTYLKYRTSHTNCYPNFDLRYTVTEKFSVYHVHPIDSRPFEYQGTDLQLYACWLKLETPGNMTIIGPHPSYNTTVSKSIASDPNFEKKTTPPQLTKQFLDYVNITDNLVLSSKANPAVDYVAFETDGNCQGNGDTHFNGALDTCFNSNNIKYKSARVYNNNCEFEIVVTRWPHHHCENGNTHQGKIARCHSACYNHVLFSIRSHLDNRHQQ